MRNFRVRQILEAENCNGLLCPLCAVVSICTVVRSTALYILGFDQILQYRQVWSLLSIFVVLRDRQFANIFLKMKQEPELMLAEPREWFLHLDCSLLQFPGGCRILSHKTFHNPPKISLHLLVGPNLQFRKY